MYKYVELKKLSLAVKRMEVSISMEQDLEKTISTLRVENVENEEFQHACNVFRHASNVTLETREKALHDAITEYSQG